MIHSPRSRARSRIACSVSPVGGPAGRVGRRVDEQRLCPWRDRRLDLADVAGPAIAGLVERDCDRDGARHAGGCGEVRPGRRQIDDLVAIAGDSVERQLDGMHARAGDDEFLLGEALAEMPDVIAGERLPQFGDAFLPGIEGLAAGQRPGSGIGDEGGRRQVALAGPERDHAVAVAAAVHDGDNAAFRRGTGLGAQILDQGHGWIRFSPSGQLACFTTGENRKPRPKSTGVLVQRILPLRYFLARRSRISVSSATSAGGAAGATGFSCSSRRRRSFTALTIRKMMKARMMKFSATVMKLP